MKKERQTKITEAFPVVSNATRPVQKIDQIQGKWSKNLLKKQAAENIYSKLVDDIIIGLLADFKTSPTADPNEEEFIHLLGKCSICLDYLDKENVIIAAKCGHVAHKNCQESIPLNSGNKRRCPECRGELDPETEATTIPVDAVSEPLEMFLPEQVQNLKIQEDEIKG